jgi:hypothetical protein
MAVIQDISGFQIFSGSELGHAHVVAHRMLDLGRFNRGHQILGEWLENRAGSGSQWVHIQWHMLVFELAVGDWQSAYARFLREVLPVALAGDQAVTDAASGLWRLALASPSATTLPWEEVASGARHRLSVEREPYVELHDLLALTGASDAQSIASWIERRRWDAKRNQTLLGFAQAFLHLASGQLLDAAAHFERVLPSMGTLGGSRAQNELFHELYRFTKRTTAERRVA